MQYIILLILLSGCSNTTVIHNKTDIKLVVSQLCGDDFLDDATNNPDHAPVKREYLINLHGNCITSLTQAILNNSLNNK
jgi:hypothetical protein